MQNNANAVFAEINRAYLQKKETVLSTNNMTSDAVARVKNMWAISRFKCTKAGKCIEDIAKMQSENKYQVRNIPIFSDSAKYQDIVIEFTADGKICDMYIALHQTAEIRNNLNKVADLRQREMVIKTLEHLRTAYNRKDLPFLEDIYSDEALIITGTVRYFERKKGDAAFNSNMQQEIKYSVQSKKDYIKKLDGIFKRNSYINIKFDEIVIGRHGRLSNIYGVTLKQSWNTSGYSDVGWLFLIFDYKDEDNPQIWVRTWQPLTRTNPVTGKKEEIRYSATGEDGTEKIFGIDDFKFR
jgi:hypothetical protein